MFVVMEELLEKLKILDYEEEVLAAHNMKAMSRYDTATAEDSGLFRRFCLHVEATELI